MGGPRTCRDSGRLVDPRDYVSDRRLPRHLEGPCREGPVGRVSHGWGSPSPAVVVRGIVARGSTLAGRQFDPRLQVGQLEPRRRGGETYVIGSIRSSVRSGGDCGRRYANGMSDRLVSCRQAGSQSRDGRMRTTGRRRCCRSRRSIVSAGPGYWGTANRTGHRHIDGRRQRP